MRVVSIMSNNVTSVRATASLSDAARLMWDCDCGALPVLAADSDRVVGVITDRDICMATWSKGLPPAAVLVSDVMSAPAYFCSSNDTVATAESLMRANKVRRLPIVDSGQRLLGILSLADIAKSVGMAHFRGDPDLSPEVFAMTVRSICEERAGQPSVAG